MLKAPDMRAGDFTCLLCGSRLELKLEKLIIGDNRGECPMCSEPFTMNVTEAEMKELIKAEETFSGKKITN